MTKSWKPIVAGIIDYIAAFGGLIVVLLDFVQEPSPGSFSSWSTWAFLVQTLLSLAAAVSAHKRRLWLLALIGSVPAIIYSFIGVPAIILIAQSKKEFR